MNRSPKKHYVIKPILCDEISMQRHITWITLKGKGVLIKQVLFLISTSSHFGPHVFVCLLLVFTAMHTQH